MKKVFAGIGSRETPESVQYWMYEIGKKLAKDYILRSGHAAGADMAFEEGMRAGKGEMEIFVPWHGFNGANMRDPIYKDASKFDDASVYAIAKQFHPAWDRCSDTAKKLHARNVYQILGQHRDYQSDLVICWTKDGKASGGTGQALRIADFYGIPIFNLYNPDERESLVAWLGF